MTSRESDGSRRAKPVGTHAIGLKWAALATLVPFASCGFTATIARTDGPDNEAQIVRSDADALYVRGSSGQIYRLGRDSVSSVDHPGNVNILVGALLAGVAGFAAGQIYAQDRRSDVAIPVALVYGLPGLGLIVWGLLQYVPSIQAARAFETAETDVRPVVPDRRPIMVPYPPPPAAPPPAAPPPAPPPLESAPPAAPGEPMRLDLSLRRDPAVPAAHPE